MPRGPNASENGTERHVDLLSNFRGGSAVFELPLNPQIVFEETIAFHRLLLGSGAPINEVNTLRKHFSAVKGGRLAMAAPEAAKVNLLVTNVPLQSLDALSSSPTFPNRSTLVRRAS